MRQVDNFLRTHDYEPFVVEFIRALSNEGLLEDIIGDAGPGDAAVTSGSRKKTTTRSRGRGRGRQR